ncbi:AAA family ATPase [Bdellovibrio sp. HCB117]|uniref:AAA family ATPase n=1 Tax=Bdellovibrio sp. HCB117 TaxID=3394359 RepID=UPI0039B42EF2
MNFQDFISALGAKKTGSGYIARCPAHDDQNPSFSINEAPNGKPLFKCLSGCSQSDVIEALTAKGLWNSKKDQSVKTKKGNTKKEKDNLKEINLEEVTQRAKSYFQSMTPEMLEYLADRGISQKTVTSFGLGKKGDRLSIPVFGADGKVEDIRLHLPKHKRTKKTPKILPDENTDPSCKLFPYQVLTWLKKAKFYHDNLEKLEILDKVDDLGSLSTQRFVPLLVICEGELDALSALSYGLPAITNTCGAGSWDDDFSSAIKEIIDLGIAVVILMDNDAAGDTGRDLRVQSITALGCKVHVAEWIERPTGHDLQDELKNYGLDGVLTLIEESKIHSDIVYMNEVEAEKIDWLFEPYIALGKVSLIEGEPGIGKSFLSLAIAASISKGGGDLPANKNTLPVQKTLLMSAEDGLGDTVKPRLLNMNADLSKIFAPSDVFTLDDKGFELLEKLIVREKASFVILDPMTPLLKAGTDVNKAVDMRPFFKRLTGIAKRYHCAIVVNRHLAKNTEQKGVSRGLGSIDIAAAVRSIVQVTAPDQKDKSLRQVEHVKCNIAAKGKPFTYFLKQDKFSWGGTMEEVLNAKDEQSGAMDLACNFLLEVLKNGPMKSTDLDALAESRFISKSTLNRAKKKLKPKVASKLVIQEDDKYWIVFFEGHNFQHNKPYWNESATDREDQEQQDSQEYQDSQTDDEPSTNDGM